MSLPEPYAEWPGHGVLYCARYSLILPFIYADFDSIVADPPYGIGKDYGELSEDTLELFQCMVADIERTGKPSAVFVPASRIYDMPVRPQWTCIWSKTWGSSGLLAYPIYPHWEGIALFNVKGKYLGNNGHRSDVFNFAPIRADADGHPTPKPEDLMCELVKFMRGDVIFDPCAGSGTTGVACIRERKQFVLCEVEPRWCSDIVSRIDRELAQPRLPFVEPPRETQAKLFDSELTEP